MAETRLGLGANALQFSLLMVVNAFVGAMVGLERAMLPLQAAEQWGRAAATGMLTFLVVFGLSKAAANAVAGLGSDRFGRKPMLLGGWLLAAPVPLLLMWAPSWGWVLVANALLGVSQGLTWSTAVVMKIDLAGPSRRGLALGLNEFAGYAAVALSAMATGYVASVYGLGPAPYALGVLYVLLGGGLSALLVRETHGHANLEAAQQGETVALTAGEIFVRTSATDPTLSAVCQAGLVNNLNDGLAWGVFPLIFAAAGLSLTEIGVVAGIYPAVWGVGQLFTGALSDRVGRKPFIVLGMWVQAAALGLVAVSDGMADFAVSLALLGAGTAMVYPTLLAAIGDAAHASWRAGAVGTYRLWRDSGYAVGALLAGALADLFGMPVAVWAVAALTFASGVWVLAWMVERRPEPMSYRPPVP